VSITIENFGTAVQSGFDVNYIVDGGTPVVETVAATVNPGATISYDFTATADLSNPATYAISSSTLLAGDSVPGNDTANTSVTNSECATTSSTDTPIAVGPNGGTVTTSVINIADDFVVDDVNVSINISHTWVGDLDITLLHPDGITSVELMPNNTCGNCDDMDVTFDDAAASSITTANAGPITGTYSPANGSLSTFNGLMTAGDWTLTITDNANGDGGQLNGWDLQLCGDMNLSIDDNTLNADLVVIHLGDNMYSIQLPTSTINDKLEMTIYNMLGQTVYRRILENSSGNGYQHELNMQYAASGIYIIRVGTRTAGTYKRIIVE
ncbi:MAG: proprotein convertase P-domain-containing protein, partial [Bacteroidia bacterium]|nr:proprotein convertase P-domain-containing protein [Bacteroidia bacterium]